MNFKGCLFVNDLENFERFSAAGRDVFGNVADFFADECFGQRRRQGNFVFLDVGFIVADNLVRFFGVGVFVDDNDGGAETDDVSGILGRIDNLSAADDGFKFLNASFDEALLFLSGGVFGVSERSPCERASAMAAMMLGRSTPFRCFNSASRATKPSLVKGNLSILLLLKKLLPANFFVGSVP